MTGLRLIALRSMADAATAEEAVQEAMARGLAAIAEERIKAPEKVGAYFRGILRHVVADLLRDRSRTLRLDLMTDPPADTSRADALATLISEEDCTRVVQALRGLPPRSRECLRLGFYEGLTPAEIARRLGEPATRVRKRRSRALKLLRAAFLAQRSTPVGRNLGRSVGHNPGSSATYMGEPQPSATRGAGLDSADRRDVDAR